MLALTNRTLIDANDASAFTRAFTPWATDLGLADVAASNASWSLTSRRAQATDDQILARLVTVFSGSKPVLFYLHGNDNTPADCFQRCLRLEGQYGVSVIAFSWTSEGYLSSGQDEPGLQNDPQAAAHGGDVEGVASGNRGMGWVKNKMQRYQRAKINAQQSVDALARMLRLLATARLYTHHQALTLAAHSLGAHFLQYTLPLPGASEAMGAMHNIALLAPCTRATGHTAWVGTLHPKGRVFVTYNTFDAVLAGAFIADGSQDLKLGAEPGDRLHTQDVRYVSFSGSNTGSLSGHHYFVADSGSPLPAASRKLFSRIFASQSDIQDGEIYRDVYPVNCDADGSTCYMHKPPETDFGG